MKLPPIVAPAICGALVIAGCGDDDGGGGGTENTLAGATEGASNNEIGVTLQEYVIIPESESVAAGEVTFTVDNIGPDDVHELMIVRTDLASDALPTLEDGTVDESAEGLEVIGETAELAVDVSEDLVVELEPGAYALICNVYEAAENEAHYDVGMHAPFTVQ